jgi:hypothetical protein
VTRVAVVLGAAGLLLLLMGWWTWATAAGLIGYRGVAALPDGSPVVLSLLRVDAVIDADRYRVASGATLIGVEGPTAELTVGEDVTVGGKVVGGRVVEQWRSAAPDRGSKRWLGLAGLVATLALAITQVRWAGSGLVLRG